MKTFPSIEEAEAIFEKGMKDIFLYEPDASPERIEATDIHSHLVAKGAYMIAQKIPDMDENRAYVLGLLHDFGKFGGDCWGKTSFHGLTGYHMLMEMGYPEIAKLSLTHTFPNKDFEVEDYSRAYNADDLKKIKELMPNIKYDDYDRLIQLSDLLVNNVDGFCSIEERMARVQKWYGVLQKVVDTVVKQASDLRKYFENKCNCDIYNLLDIKEDNNEQKTNSSRS